MFNRPPRIQDPLPDDLVKIPGPPPLPNSPGGFSWLTIGLPVLATVLSVVLMLSISGLAAAGSFLIFIPVMLATYLASGLAYWLQRRDYTRSVIKAQESYTTDLRKIEAQLDKLKQKEELLRRQNDPDFQTCLQAAERQDSSLGERRPGDRDFLAVRLGSSDLPASFHIEPPSLNPRPIEFQNQFEKIEQMLAAYGKVQHVPFIVPLQKIGSLGLAGPRVHTNAITRQMLCQLATHHWPSELEFIVIANAGELKNWKWIVDFPHSREWWFYENEIIQGEVNPYLPILVKLEAELRKREHLTRTEGLTDNKEPTKLVRIPQLIVIIDQLDNVASNPALTLLLQMGKSLGVHGIFLEEASREIPSECGAILDLDFGQHPIKLNYLETGVDGLKGTCQPDETSPEEASKLAHALGRISWLLPEDASQPPFKVSFLDMLGMNSLSELDLETWWSGKQPYGYLCAPIGKTSRDADLVFDLNDREGANGPHGLIGGMSGSGKSELLRTIILSFALLHHPNELNFALIDFKGGAAFNDLIKLPHTVGVVTDLENHANYAERIILSLTSELGRREQIIGFAQQQYDLPRAHIDDYRLIEGQPTLPRLLIIFDEFAEFKQKHPEESKALIGIARKGRSLGMHLILATQNLRAAVDDQVRQNSNFLIALRVSEPADSSELIGSPDAAFLTRGRAFLRTTRTILFQIAYSGSAYRGTLLPDDAIVRIHPNNRRQVLYPLNWNSVSIGDQKAKTEAQAIVETIQATSNHLRLPEPRAVWQNALPTRVYLLETLTLQRRISWDGTRWNGRQPGPVLFLGLLDDPANQEQRALQFKPSEEGGHLIIFGSPGSGKSTMLRTVVTCLALSLSPSQVNIYIADLAGRPAMKIFERLPHVRAVVTHFERERLERLIRVLHAQIKERTQLLHLAQADDWIAYNQKAINEDLQLASIFVLIDDFGALKRIDPELVKEFATLANAGRSLGIYFVITANTDSDLSTDLFNMIPIKLSFFQAQRNTFNTLVGYIPDARIEAEFGTRIKPGRGLVRSNPPLFFQAFLPSNGKDDQEQLQKLNLMIAEMGAHWNTNTLDAPQVATLRQEILLSEILGSSENRAIPFNPPFVEADGSSLEIALGQSYDTLDTASINLGQDGHLFLISAINPRLGKTTALVTWALALAEYYAPAQIQFVFVNFERRFRTLKNLPHTREYLDGNSRLESGFQDLQNEIQRRRERSREINSIPDDEDMVTDWRQPGIVIFIDDYPDFVEDFTDNEKAQFLSAFNDLKDLGIYLVLAGDLSELPTDYQDSLMKKVRAQGSGILFSPRDGIDQYKNAKLPYTGIQSLFGPGRGFLIKRGQPQLVQVANYVRANETTKDALSSWVMRLKQKYPVETGSFNAPESSNGQGKQNEATFQSH